MFEMDKENTIRLTRGDSAYLDVAASDGGDLPVDIKEAVLTVRPKVDKDIVLQKKAKQWGLLQ